MARGSIGKRVGPKGTAYRVRVEYDPDPVTGKRRQESKTFYNKRQAEKRLSDWLSEIERGTAVDPSDMTIAEFMRHWLDTTASRTVKATTLVDYRKTVEKQIVPGLGSVKLQALKPAGIDQFYATPTANRIGERTIELCHARLKQALKQAVQWQVIAVIPAERAMKPKGGDTREGIGHDEDQVAQFLAVANGTTYDLLWLVALETGARQGELLALTWDDFDEHAGRSGSTRHWQCFTTPAWKRANDHG